MDAVVQMQILAMLAAITRVFRAQHIGRGKYSNRTIDRLDRIYKVSLLRTTHKAMTYLLACNNNGQVILATAMSETVVGTLRRLPQLKTLHIFFRREQNQQGRRKLCVCYCSLYKSKVDNEHLTTNS